MSKEEKNTYTIKTDENLGEIKIADEVVAIIAGLAEIMMMDLPFFLIWFIN